MFSSYCSKPFDLTGDMQQLKSKLLEKGFHPQHPTLVIWEGATFYFEPEYMYAILKFLSNEVKNLKVLVGRELIKDSKLIPKTIYFCEASNYENPGL